MPFQSAPRKQVRCSWINKFLYLFCQNGDLPLRPRHWFHINREKCLQNPTWQSAVFLCNPCLFSGLWFPPFYCTFPCLAFDSAPLPTMSYFPCKEKYGMRAFLDPAQTRALGQVFDKAALGIGRQIIRPLETLTTLAIWLILTPNCLS